MQIKQLTHYAGPLGNHAPESVWDCPREEALGLIEGGYAVQVEAEKVERAEATTAGEETTAAGAAVETTEAAKAGEKTTEKKGFLKRKK